MQYLGPKTTDLKEVVLFEDLLSSVTVYDTFALALASTGTRSKIVTNGHTTEGIGGATYTSTGTTGTPGTGNEALFYNADGTGYEIDTSLGYLTIEQFGVVGGAHVADQGAHVDEVAKLNSVMNTAVSKKIGIRDETEKTVATTTWHIKNGCEYVNLQHTTLVGHGVTAVGIIRLGLKYTQPDGSTTGVALDSCQITAKIDCLEKDPFAIYADSATNNTIKDCEIVGIGSPNQNGIYLRSRCDNNLILNNSITMTQDVQDGTISQYGIRINGFFPDYGGYLDVATTIPEPTEPARNNRIIGNTVKYGSAAILLTGATDNVIRENETYGQSHRGIYLQGCSHRNQVLNNKIDEYFSSAVLVNYNSTDCVISDNIATKIGEIYTDAGEAAINVQLGAKNTVVSDNIINSTTSFGVYVGPGCSTTKVKSNIIKGYRRAGICVESDWYRPVHASSVAHRPFYAAPPAGAWTKEDLEDVSVVNNLIGYGEREVGYFSTGLAFLQPGTTWELKDLKNVGNVVVDAAGIDYVIHYFEEQSGFLTGVATPVAADDLTPAKYVYLPSGGVQSANYLDYSTEIVSKMRNGTYIGLDDDHGIVGNETEFEVVIKFGVPTTRPTVEHPIFGGNGNRGRLQIDPDGTVRAHVRTITTTLTHYVSTTVLPDLDPYTPMWLKLRWESGTTFEALYSLDRERESSDVENWISLGASTPNTSGLNTLMNTTPLTIGSWDAGLLATSINLYSLDAYTNNGLVAHVRPLWLNGTAPVRSPSGELVTVYTPEVDSTYETTRAYR